MRFVGTFCVKNVWLFAFRALKIFLLFVDFIIAIATHRQLLRYLWFHPVAFFTLDIIVDHHIFHWVYGHFNLMNSLLYLFWAHNVEFLRVNIRFPLFVLGINYFIKLDFLFYLDGFVLRGPILGWETIFLCWFNWIPLWFEHLLDFGNTSLWSFEVNFFVISIHIQFPLLEVFLIPLINYHRFLLENRVNLTS
jgi:hypothetical protein